MSGFWLPSFYPLGCAAFVRVKWILTSETEMVTTPVNEHSHDKKSTWLRLPTTGLSTGLVCKFLQRSLQLDLIVEGLGHCNHSKFWILKPSLFHYRMSLILPAGQWELAPINSLETALHRPALPRLVASPHPFRIDRIYSPIHFSSNLRVPSAC